MLYSVTAFTAVIQSSLLLRIIYTAIGGKYALFRGFYDQFENLGEKFTGNKKIAHTG